MPVPNYPKPPFKAQQQSFPGKTDKLDPRPDHGEESYVGHGLLKGKKALITGGDSGISRNVIGALFSASCQFSARIQF
ncbi:hypothetical protein QE447_002867 [Stenotrophomonas sp. SORGH_AS282]|nr:hypothetical protein [Stenotrophomonas sp. SORGH_AS_0282]MDQ1190364.1 hypothetical protein [Stenotrophomonas sp. SORGH_AS_0282]